MNSTFIHLGLLNVFTDAFNFIFHQQEARTGSTLVGGPDQALHLIGQHLKVTFLALGAAVAIALPAGVILGHLRRGEGVAVAIGNAGRAVPELALIAFVAAFIGVGLGQRHLRVRRARDPPDPHQHLCGDEPGGPKRRRGRAEGWG